MDRPEPTRGEPCSACDRPTRAGSPLFAGRRTIAADHEQEATRYLCASCEAEIHRARKVAHLSDAELKRLIENGSVAGITYAGMGSLTAFVGGPR